jgi:cyclophilin family peptidyl-prolyl cis-trans isomerase
MGKINFMVLIFAFLVFTGCGKSDQPQTTGERTDTVQTQTTTQMETPQETSPEDTNKNAADQKAEDQATDSDIVEMKTTEGTIKIKLFTDKAPITAGNFKKLVQQKFYDGIIFHRVIDGFMIQTGDPTGTGTGGSNETIKDEFAPGLVHDKKGILSMANRGPNTGTSQFFITLDATPWLDGKHAIFGEVIEGMDVVDKIGKTQTGANDKPVKEIKMITVRMVD